MMVPQNPDVAVTKSAFFRALTRHVSDPTQVVSTLSEKEKKDVLELLFSLTKTVLLYNPTAFELEDLKHDPKFTLCNERVKARTGLSHIKGKGGDVTYLSAQEAHGRGMDYLKDFLKNFKDKSSHLFMDLETEKLIRA
jgi:hypothetical protein